MVEEPETDADELLSTSIFLFLVDRMASMASSASSLFTERGSARNDDEGALTRAVGSMSSGDSARTRILSMRNW